MKKKKKKYFRLVIVANDPKTDIWLSDDEGFFVQTEMGVLDTSLLPGDYFVEFGLGTRKWPVVLAGNLKCYESEIYQ